MISLLEATWGENSLLKENSEILIKPPIIHTKTDEVIVDKPKQKIIQLYFRSNWLI